MFVCLCLFTPTAVDACLRMLRTSIKCRLDMVRDCSCTKILKCCAHVTYALCKCKTSSFSKHNHLITSLQTQLQTPLQHHTKFQVEFAKAQPNISSLTESRYGIINFVKPAPDPSHCKSSLDSEFQVKHKRVCLYRDAIKNETR